MRTTIKLKPTLDLYIKGGGHIRGCKDKKSRKNRGKLRNVRRPPLAKFGADAVRAFADHTTGVGGTGVRSAMPVVLGMQKVVRGVC